MSDPKPMRLWFCFNCSTAFQSPKNTCTDCGADGDDPQSAGCIAPQMTHHFDPPHGVLKGRGKGYHACDPKVKVGTGGMRATGERAVVNCPACRASKVFLDVGQQEEVISPYHVPEVPVLTQSLPLDDAGKIAKVNAEIDELEREERAGGLE